jgi:hypothetical protein
MFVACIIVIVARVCAREGFGMPAVRMKLRITDYVDQKCMAGGLFETRESTRTHRINNVLVAVFVPSFSS